MTVVNLSPAEMQGFRASAVSNPSTAKLYALIVAHATRAGGRTLAVWRLHMGRLFGEPVMMTFDEVATRLNIPVSEVNRVVGETLKVVRPAWEASPEFDA